MNFDDVRDQIKDRAESLWGFISESSLFISIKERYENLSRPVQKVIFWSGVTVLVLMILSIPYSYFSSTSELNDEFTTNRKLIEELIRASRSNEIPSSFPVAPSADQLDQSVQGILTNSGLLPEQIKPTEKLTPDKYSSLIPPSIKQEGIRINLEKLNLKQIIGIAYQISKMHPAVKLKGLQISPHSESPQYSNATLTIISLTPPLPSIESDLSEKKPSKSKKPVEKHKKSEPLNDLDN